MTARIAGDSAGKPATVAIALGGGGARGLAHIAMLEAMDELGVRPTAISGTSIGAVVGAAYAAGVPARGLREHVLRQVANRPAAMSKLMKARVGRFADLVTQRFANPVLLDAAICLDLFWPKQVPDNFEDLATPLLVVATDFYGRREIVIREGPLTSAVAASMALPGLVKPVEIAGLVLIDGGAVNALPYDLLAQSAAVVAAVDVTFGGRSKTRASPSPFQAMFGAAQIMQEAVTNQKLQMRAPDILVKPDVGDFNVLDFFKAKAIFAACGPAKDEFKRRLEATMG